MIRDMRKVLVGVLSFFFLAMNSYALVTLKGRVLPHSSKNDCQENVQLFLASRDILLYQIEVPIGGSFQFSLVNEDYTLSAVAKDGCRSGLMSLSLKGKTNETVVVEIK
jgi:hypothetical protein